MLTIFAAKTPASDAETYAWLNDKRETYHNNDAAADQVLVKFHDAITRLFPCLSSCADDDAMDACPWSDGPLINNFVGDMGVVGISQRHEEVIPQILRFGNTLGLTVIDEQQGVIHRPQRYRIVLQGVKEDMTVNAVADKLAPLFKRTPARVADMLAQQGLVLKKDLTQIVAQTYVATLVQYGCVCIMEPEIIVASTSATAEPGSTAPIENTEQAAATTPSADADEAMQRWIAYNNTGKKKEAADKPEPEIVNYDDIRIAELADGQKQLIYAVALNFAVLSMKSDVIGFFTIAFCLLPIEVMFFAGYLKLAANMGFNNTMRKVIAYGSMVPLVNTFILLAINDEVNRQLKDAGLRPSILGLSARQRASLNEDICPPPGRPLKWAIGTAIFIAAVIGIAHWRISIPKDKRLDSSLPCAMMGNWVFTGTSTQKIVRLDKDGSMQSSAGIMGTSPYSGLDGTWKVQDRHLLLQGKNDRPAKQGKPVILSKDGKTMTLIDEENEKQDYMLIEALAPYNCNR
ncbi:hypothetical protein [Undibacterium sp. Ji42W]|uniref:hypothetical protein n=1 Tax=Undibacterium sp. Ji42W TaxID=3413039 RepID=UPI003BF4F357